jgi:hypothetical protein
MHDIYIIKRFEASLKTLTTLVIAAHSRDK